MEPIQLAAFAIFLVAIYYYTTTGEAHYSKAAAYSKSGNEQKAAQQLALAAKKGHVEAMYEIGEICLQNDKEIEAEEWLTKAANKNHKKAQEHLADLFIKQEDYSRAFTWLEKSVQDGNIQAYISLAKLYNEGLGCEKDIEKATQLLTVAIDKNNPHAMHDLAEIVKIDNPKQAFELHQRAANNGFIDSMFALYEILENGIGAEKKPQDAAKWLQLAANNGHKKAISMIAAQASQVSSS